jgi:hypothetical protein
MSMGQYSDAEFCALVEHGLYLGRAAASLARPATKASRSQDRNTRRASKVRKSFRISQTMWM